MRYLLKESRSILSPLKVKLNCKGLKAEKMLKIQ